MADLKDGGVELATLSPQVPVEVPTFELNGDGGAVGGGGEGDSVVDMEPSKEGVDGLRDGVDEKKSGGFRDFENFLEQPHFMGFTGTEITRGATFFSETKFSEPVCCLDPDEEKEEKEKACGGGSTSLF